MRYSKKRTASSGLTIALASLVVLVGLGLLLWRPWSGKKYEGNLKFYCAAGMTRPVTEIIENYQGEFPKVSIKPNFGGSGEMISSMVAAQGEGDLYLSADSFHMEKAKEKGLIAETIPVAKIHPVLVINRESEGEIESITELKHLLRSELTVILGAETTAVGRVTRDVLRDVGLWEKVTNRKEGKNVTGATVNDVAIKVGTTRKSVGIVWDITAIQHKSKLKVIDIPNLKLVSQQIWIGVLAKSKQPTQALRFARYLAAENKGLMVFRSFHFTPTPDADTWEKEPEIVLAAGAMLQDGIEKTVNAFAEREGVKVTTAYAGCGILVGDMKILQGKNEKGRKLEKFPDAYFSCDVSFMKDVKNWFETSVVVSKNDMVLVVKKGNPKNIRSLDDLKRLELVVGLGDTERSALGKLTDDILIRLKYRNAVYSPDRKKPVVPKSEGHDLVNNVGIGAMDVAVVYRSNAKSAIENGLKVEIQELNIPSAFATQPFAVAKQSKHKYMMRRLLKAILEEQTTIRMKRLGFKIVKE